MGLFMSTEQVLSEDDIRSRQFITRENVSLAERFVVGSIYFSLSITALALQFSVLLVFLRYADYRQNACYRCMIAIAVADCAQIIPLFYGSFLVFFNASFSVLVEQIMGSIANAAFVSLMPLDFTLALNRLLIVMDRPLRTCVWDALIGASASWGLVFVVASFKPHMQVGYRRYEWAYQGQKESIAIIEYAEETTEFIFISLSLVAYVCSFIVCIMKRSQLRPNRHSWTQHEFMLLVQCFILFLSKGSMILVWHARGTLYHSTVNNSIACTTYWIIICALNPLVYLYMNGKMRQRLLLLWTTVAGRSGQSSTIWTI